MPNSVNAETLKLIKQFEGVRLNAYPDPAHGWDVPTIGYGHTSAAGGPVVTKGMKITQAEADSILLKDLEAVVATVRKYVKVPIDANQEGALVSFIFNLGESNFAKSTLLKKLNAKDYHGAANEFKKWNKARGKVLAGLTKRRAAETALFTKPVKSIPTIPFNPPVSERPKTLADWFGSIFGNTRSNKVTEAAKPNWLSGLVGTTAFKYLVAIAAGWLANKLGLDPTEGKASIEGIFSALVSAAMLAWGAWESSRSKVVVNGERVSVSSMPATDQKAVADIVKKNK